MNEQKAFRKQQFRIILLKVLLMKELIFYRTKNLLINCLN